MKNTWEISKKVRYLASRKEWDVLEHEIGWGLGGGQYLAAGGTPQPTAGRNPRSQHIYTQESTGRMVFSSSRVPDKLSTAVKKNSWNVTNLLDANVGKGSRIVEGCPAGCTLPSPWDSLDQFQQTPVSLSSGRSQFGRWIDGWIKMQDGLLKKKKNQINCMLVLPFEALFYFLFPHSKLFTACWTFYDYIKGGHRCAAHGGCGVWEQRDAQEPWQCGTLFHRVSAHQSQMGFGPEKLLACLNGVDKTFSLSSNGLAWLCVQSCQQRCPSKTSRNFPSLLFSSFSLLWSPVGTFRTIFSWLNAITI